jgi:hypothetical protein
VILEIASTMAREGSEGVENTLSIRSRRVEGSIHTQSVNVPPVSIAMRRGSERRAMVAEN